MNEALSRAGTALVHRGTEYGSFAMLDILYDLVVFISQKRIQRYDLFMDMSFKSFKLFRKSEIFTRVHDLGEYANKMADYDIEYFLDEVKDESIVDQFYDQCFCKNTGKKFHTVKTTELNLQFSKNIRGSKMFYIIHFDLDSMKIEDIRLSLLDFIKQLTVERRPYIIIGNTQFATSIRDSLELCKILSMGICYVGVDSIESKVCSSLGIPFLVHKDSIKPKSVLSYKEIKINNFSGKRLGIEKVRRHASQRWAVNNLLV